ncbi:MAG: WD40 repeat domain-containing protein [Crocinitomicaceae bacterium]
MNSTSDASIVRHCLTIRGHAGAVYAMEQDGRFLYSAAADKFVTRWDLASGAQDNFAIKFEDVPYCLTFLRDNSLLVVGTNSGKLHVFDLETRTEIKCFHQHKTALFNITVNKVNKHFYTADADGNISVWCSETLGLLLSIPLNCGKVRRMILDEKEAILYIAAQNGYILKVDTLYFNLIQTIDAHHDGATAICLDSQNNVLYSGGKDAILKCWDLTNGKLLHSLPAHNFVIYDIVALSEDLLATVSRDKSIKIWNKKALQVMEKVDAFKQGHHHSVNQLVYLGDQKFATCSDDKTIRVFSY